MSLEKNLLASKLSFYEIDFHPLGRQFVYFGRQVIINGAGSQFLRCAETVDHFDPNAGSQIWHFAIIMLGDNKSLSRALELKRSADWMSS